MKEGSSKTAAVYVLGCKVNQAEAAAMERVLHEKGYTVCSGESRADLVVVNTCCVTSRAEAKSRRLVRRLMELHPRSEFIITGCLAEVSPDAFGSLPSCTSVLGTWEKERFSEYVDAAPHSTVRKATETVGKCGEIGFGVAAERSRAFLKVQDGCSQHCSYCIVPRARGPSRSLPLQQALEYASRIEEMGFSEAVLTGVHLGMYGRDLVPASSLEELTERLLDSCPGLRLRFSSVEPPEITPGLIELAASHPRVCRHFHIPLQSGDDRVLERMGRPYDTAMMESLVAAIRRASPEVCLGMDVMVGFPGEDDESFERTRRVIERLQPSYLHVFPFSPRPGTPAAHFAPRVDSTVATKRAAELRALSDSLKAAFHAGLVGRTLEVVPEENAGDDSDTMLARSDNYVLVNVPRSGINCTERVFRVRVERVSDGKVWAYPISEDD